MSAAERFDGLIGEVLDEILMELMSIDFRSYGPLASHVIRPRHVPAVKVPVIEIVFEKHLASIRTRDAQPVKLGRRLVYSRHARSPAWYFAESIALELPLAVDPHFDLGAAGNQPHAVPAVASYRETDVTGRGVIALAVDDLLDAEVLVGRAENQTVEVRRILVAKHESAVSHSGQTS